MKKRKRVCLVFADIFREDLATMCECLAQCLVGVILFVFEI